jgi:hypothetical protein
MNLFIYLFCISGIIIGFARGICEGANWNWKDGIINRNYVNSSGKYHLFTLLEYFGVFILAYASILYGESGDNTTLMSVIFSLIIFFNYYYFYSKSFNYTRYRDWYDNKYYVVSLFGINIKIKYISEFWGFILVICSVFIAIIIDYIY